MPLTRARAVPLVFSLGALLYSVAALIEPVTCAILTGEFVRSALCRNCTQHRHRQATLYTGTVMQRCTPAPSGNAVHRHRQTTLYIGIIRQRCTHAPSGTAVHRHCRVTLHACTVKQRCTPAQSGKAVHRHRPAMLYFGQSRLWCTRHGPRHTNLIFRNNLVKVFPGYGILNLLKNAK